MRAAEIKLRDPSSSLVRDRCAVAVGAAEQGFRAGESTPERSGMTSPKKTSAAFPSLRKPKPAGGGNNGTILQRVCLRINRQRRNTQPNNRPQQTCLSLAPAACPNIHRFIRCSPTVSQFVSRTRNVLPVTRNGGLPCKQIPGRGGCLRHRCCRCSDEPRSIRSQACCGSDSRSRRVRVSLRLRALPMCAFDSSLTCRQ